jgi:ATP-dependent Clp endopeptidase proteolytic subunit ClpP
MKRKEILIYGNIGNSWYGKGIVAADFRRELIAAQDDPNISGIDVRINSPGGSVFEGVAMFNAMASATKEVHTHNDGIAYSMGAILLLAGNKVFAAKNSTGMLHNAGGGVFGNASDLRQAVEMLDKLDNSMMISIADRIGLTVEAVKAKWFDYKDHTLSAEEMRTEKLVDEIVDMKAKVPDNISAMSQEELFAYYGNLNTEDKKGFFSRIEEKIEAGFKKLTQTTNDMKIKIQNKWEALATLLALTFKSGETEKEFEIKDEHLEKINAELKNIEALKNSLIAAEKKFSDEHTAFEAFKKASPDAREVKKDKNTLDDVETAPPAHNETSVDKEAKKIIAAAKKIADLKL